MQKTVTHISQLRTLGESILPKDSALWLYGSQARGDANVNSDWDLLIVLNKDKQELSDFDRYSYPFIQFGADEGIVISAQLYTKKEWEGISFSPFYKNVERDKIVLI